jgi:MFS transporter, Spinster family, sphingosine-1-phosphate transporter
MRRAGWLLALLTVLNILSWIDRQIIPALAPLLMADLGLTSAQIGLLYGYAFILCFIAAGIVIGPIADRVHRPRLIAAGLTAWSAFTAISGAATSFIQLAGARVVVGIGEATLVPASLAMLSDAFPVRWRARAAGIFAIGLPLGSGFSLVIAGLLAPRYGWRSCFYILGVVGVLAALLVAMAPETAARRESPKRETRPMGEFLRTLRQSPALLLTIAGGVLITFSTAASIHVLTWLVRERGFEFRQAAIMAGGIYALGGTIGNVAGGWLADWCETRWRGGRLWSIVGVQLLLVPATIVFFTSERGSTAFFIGWILSSLRGTIWYGPLFVATQEMVPPTSRATAVAFLMLAGNLLGAGPGPWLAGAIGDRWSLTTGLIATTWLGLTAVIPFALAARSSPLPSEVGAQQPPTALR